MFQWMVLNFLVRAPHFKKRFVLMLSQRKETSACEGKEGRV